MSAKDEELNKNQGSDGQNISGQSTSFSTGVPGSNAGASKDKKSSGQYANIQSYLDANKEQANQMGSNIAGNIETKGAEAKTAVQGFEAKAPKVDAYDPNAAIAKATQLTDQEKQQYKTNRQTGGYSGPEDISGVENYADTQAKATEAAQAAKNAATEEGQQALLKQTYARPTYSTGQNKLDQVLLQGSDQSRQALQDASQKYSALDAYFNDAQTKVGSAINDAKTQALANKNMFTPAEQAAKNQINTALQERAKQQTAQNLALINSAREDLTDNTVNSDLYDRLGLGAFDNKTIYDLNLGNYLGTNATQLGVNDVATAEERQKYKALADLFGDQSMNQVTDQGGNINPVSFDQARFAADLAKKEAEYQGMANQKNSDYANWLRNKFGWAPDATVNEYAIMDRSLNELVRDKNSVARELAAGGLWDINDSAIDPIAAQRLNTINEYINYKQSPYRATRTLSRQGGGK